MDQMQFTGERYVPELAGDIELEHRHRYLMANYLATDKDVLDIASGEGYGSAMLAQTARSVIGVDVSAEAVDHARSRYTLRNLRFAKGDCAEIPLPSSSIDVVVSFETIEHHVRHEEMMAEIKRVLRPNGLLLISSPDKFNYTVEPNYHNPHHVRELFEQDFKNLLANYFARSRFYRQRIVSGSAIIAERALTEFENFYSTENGNVERAESLNRPIYWVAIASDIDLPSVSSGFFEPANYFADKEFAINQREEKIVKLQADNSDLRRQVRRAEIQHYRSQVDNAAAIIQKNKQIASKDLLLDELNKKLSSIEVLRNSEDESNSSSAADILRQAEAKVTELEATVNERNYRINALRSSRSMRITRPFRTVGTFVRRTHRLLKLSGPAIKHGGGLFQSANKAFRIYRTSGMLGIKKALNSVDPKKTP